MANKWKKIPKNAEGKFRRDYDNAERNFDLKVGMLLKGERKGKTVYQLVGNINVSKGSCSCCDYLDETTYTHYRMVDLPELYPKKPCPFCNGKCSTCEDCLGSGEVPAGA